MATSSDRKYNTNDMDSDVIVDLPTVIVEVNAVGSRVRSLTSAYQELRIGFSLSDDLLTIGHNAIFKPGHFWTWRALRHRRQVPKHCAGFLYSQRLLNQVLNISFN